MADEKDRFGETMKLLDRAKEDIYFAARDQELIAKLRSLLKRLERKGVELRCPKCPGLLDAYIFEEVMLDRCRDCGGIWMDKGELESVIRRISRGPLRAWIDRLTAKDS